MKPPVTCLATVFVLAAAVTLADVPEIENQFRAAYELHLGAQHTADVAQLDAKYLAALDRAMQSATQGKKLDDALAFRDEIQRVTDKVPLPETDDGVAPALAKVRATYREQLAKLHSKHRKAAAPIIAKFDAALSVYQDQLTTAGKLDEAYQVRDYRAAGLAEKLMGKGAAVSLTAATAAPEKPFENSLGMRFVPVPITGGASDGKTIRFSVWETRVKDYAAFVKDEKLDWPKPDFGQEADHPAVMVNCEDALAFCEWLTKHERRKRKIAATDVYRLPTDHEWSCAVGIAKVEEPSQSPMAKDGKLRGFPWGIEFPPPKGAGNFYGEENSRKPLEGRIPIPGYNDSFDRTSPVGSFGADSFGLYDLSGSVWEWTQDFYEPDKPERNALRGGAWDGASEADLLSSARVRGGRTFRWGAGGFRVVLEVGTGG